jgi:pentatricopeptide repeat protein
MGIEEFLLDRAKKEGKYEEAIAIAREMKADGVSIEQIAKFTKLSIEDIKKL